MDVIGGLIQGKSRPTFELFKSTVCHILKELGDVEFLLYTLQEDHVTALWDKKWHPESLYLLAMIDYISRVNSVPLRAKYNNYRLAKLSKTIYPSGIRLLSLGEDGASMLKKSFDDAIPEFQRFNIVENEVRNVI